MAVLKSFYGTMPDGKEVELFSITNNNNVTLQVITFGAILQALYTPDKFGRLNDITVGFDSLYGHVNFSDYQGKTVGRYANRLCHSSFNVSGNDVQIEANEKGGNCCHSAGEFSDVVWDAEIVGDNAVKMTYTSPDGNKGYEGAVTAVVLYTLTDDNKVVIDYDVVADKTTVLNFTNHTYFNLSGSASGDVLDHVLKINADYYTPTDSFSIPTGELRAVKGTAFDFNEPKTIGRDIGENDEQLVMCRGYDHNFCLSKKDNEPCAEVFEPVSGRTLKAYTDLPGVQLYTGNFLDGTVLGKGGMPMPKHNGFCLETQHYPDTPNHPDFPQCTFKAGEHFISRTIYEVGLQK